jgi:hypothetical protein
MLQQIARKRHARFYWRALANALVGSTAHQLVNGLAHVNEILGLLLIRRSIGNFRRMSFGKTSLQLRLHARRWRRRLSRGSGAAARDGERPARKRGAHIVGAWLNDSAMRRRQERCFKRCTACVHTARRAAHESNGDAVANFRIANPTDNAFTAKAGRELPAAVWKRGAREFRRRRCLSARA